MMKKLAELTIKKSADWNNEIIKTLEKEGFTIVLETDLTIESRYIIAKEITTYKYT